MERPILTAELLSIGTELTTGETRDTNSGDLARELSGLGIAVLLLAALPDDLDAVQDAFREALQRADLVVSTGGLGPTPDDLTREAIAAVCDETPAVDPALEAWLRDLFERRGTRMAETNRKQAWLIPSAKPLPNKNGTAPGWWVERRDGRVMAALPGPPTEMRPMWRDEVLPRLRRRGAGRERVSRTLRLTGIGESAVAELLGESVLRASNPSVATYARADAVDVRVTATPEAGGDGAGRTARELVDVTLRQLEARLSPYVFGRDDETWTTVIGRRLAGRRLALAEIGTGGSLVALVGDAPWLVRAEVLAPSVDSRDWAPERAQPVAGPGDGLDHGLDELAEAVRRRPQAQFGVAVRAHERGADTAVSIAIASDRGISRQEKIALLGGSEGRRRAALVACAALWEHLAEG
ncbi:MAG: molybdopterin-binding protein [Chloroflexota bacterium]|nr:molybdopterin-binding protein [Chloroflexota bacterium]